MTSRGITLTYYFCTFVCLLSDRTAFGYAGNTEEGQKKKRHGTCRTYQKGQKAHARRAISGEMRYIKDYLNEHREIHKQTKIRFLHS